MPKTAVFTIASKNYLAYARTLLRSVAEQHQDCDLYLVLADEIENSFTPSDEPFAVILSNELRIPAFPAFSFKYSLLEFNTAVKPFAMRLLLERGYERVLYFDPDIVVYSPLAPVFEQLERHHVVLTPHMLAPLPNGEGLLPDDRLIRLIGAYNLGFIAVARSETTERFLAWWSDKCYSSCYEELEQGLFVDQAWVNLVPSLFEPVAILRHPGCNMAYWNLHERVLDDTTVNGTVPLVFYHFSGFSTQDIESISHFQNRLTLDERPDLRSIFEDYRARLLANGHERCREWRYAYGSYTNGEGIGPMARRLYFNVMQQYPNPFAVGRGTYHELLRRRKLLETTTKVTALPRNERNRKAGVVNWLLKMALHAFGPDQYRSFMGYLQRTAVLRNQGFLLDS